MLALQVADNSLSHTVINELLVNVLLFSDFRFLDILISRKYKEKEKIGWK